jgi:exo-beta-1,3-glucanase (GH17 family)
MQAISRCKYTALQQRTRAFCGSEQERGAGGIFAYGYQAFTVPRHPADGSCSSAAVVDAVLEGLVQSYC